MLPAKPQRDARKEVTLSEGSRIRDSTRGTVLIVEDDDGFAHDFVAPHFQRDWRIEFAYNIPQARAILDTISRLRLAFVDLDVPGGTPFNPKKPGGYGFEIVARIRREFPTIRVVVLTAHLTPALVNTAQELGADYLFKEQCQRNLKLIAKQLFTDEHVADERIRSFVNQFAVDHKLSPRQSEVVALAVCGMRNRHIAEKLNMSPNTLKRHIDHVLVKSAHPTLASIALLFQRKAYED